MSVYFGGSRSLVRSTIIPQVVQAVIESGQSVHVGCQFGADQQVIQSSRSSSLVVFAVAGQAGSLPHVQAAFRAGAQVHFQAGGSSAPIKARYLLRSLAGARGCSAAVFFSPGAGSLAVASRLVLSMPVFAFGEQPAPIPQAGGRWVRSCFWSFPCWQWQVEQLSFL